MLVQRLRRHVLALRWFAAFWGVAVALYCLVRFGGTSESVDWLTSPWMIPLFWAICTLSLALIDWGSTLLIDKYFLRNRTFGHIVVLKGLTLVLAVLLLTLATRLMAAAAGQIEWSDLLPNLLRKLREVRFTVAG